MDLWGSNPSERTPGSTQLSRRGDHVTGPC